VAGLLGTGVGWSQPPAKRQRPVDKVKGLDAPAEDTTQKIVGGTPAPPGKYPFQVALIASNAPVGREHFGQFCGGSLIDKDWVLTAAHCVPDTTAAEVDVYVGSNVLPSGSGGGTGTRLHVSQIVSHQDYDPETQDNDIALLKLQASAPAALKPAAIATAADVTTLGANGKKVTVIGWGATAEGGNTTPKLMQVEVTVQDRALCESNYKAVVPTSDITDNMWCAGEPAGGKDSCQGDSGGFIGAAKDDGFVQLGVVSWGIGCAQPDLFGVYTQVGNFGEWVKKMMDSF
jgi:secreted trypsin-like serine protease